MTLDPYLAAKGVRVGLQEVLGHAVHARLAMDTLEAIVLQEIRSGHYPTYRGHPWTRVQYQDLEMAGQALEVAIHMLKAVIFPEMQHQHDASVGRRLERLNRSYHQSQDSDHSHAELLPSDELRNQLED